MDAAIKAKWVEALRSGKYSQTRGTLRDADGFCCLGVLCDVIDPSDWSGDDSGGWEYDDLDTELSWDLQQRVDLLQSQQEELMWLNDGRDPAERPGMSEMRPHSFAEIADYIERSL